MNKVEKIKAEIEKRKDEFMTQANSFESLGMTEKVTYFSALASNMAALIRYIDSLEEEPISENLQKAAEQDVCEVVNTCSAIGIPNDHIPSWVQDAMANEFIHGAQWQKEKIIGKACSFLHHYQEYPNHDISADTLVEAFKMYIEL